MYEMIENNFTSHGRCRYMTENGDIIFMGRTKDGFVGKIKFKDKRCVHSPLYITIPVANDFGGIYVDVKYPPNGDYDIENMQSIIADFGEIVNHWISMMYDIRIMEHGKNEDAIKKRIQVQALRGYPELKDMTETVFVV